MESAGFACSRISRGHLEMAPPARQPRLHGIGQVQADANPTSHTIRVREVEVSCEELVDKARLRIISAAWTPSIDPLLVVITSDNYLRYNHLFIMSLFCYLSYSPLLVHSIFEADGDRDVHSALACVRILPLAQLPHLPTNPYSTTSGGAGGPLSSRPPSAFGSLPAAVSRRSRELAGRLHDIVAVHLLETGERDVAASALDTLALSSTGRIFRVLSQQCSRYSLEDDTRTVHPYIIHDCVYSLDKTAVSP